MNKTLCFAAFSAGAVLAGTGVASAQDAHAPPEQAASHPHTVAPGESLSKISRAELGTPDRWVEIFALNRDIIQDPDAIDVGQVLDVPSVPVAVPPDLFAALAPAPATPPPPERTKVAAVRQPGPSAGGTRSSRRGDGGLAAVRACESGGNYGAVSADGRYRGAYQFDRQTWQSVGGSGDPAAASPGEQDARAGQLRSQRGSNPWPSCG